jgi:hypothetical protein
LVVSAGVPVRLSSPLRAQPAAFGPTAEKAGNPARTEARLESPAQKARRAETVRASEGGSRGGRNDLAIARSRDPAARAAGLGSEVEGRGDEGQAQTPEIVPSQSALASGSPSRAPADRRQLAGYGPSLERPDADADADARIPEAARQRVRPEYAARSGHPRSLPIQIVADGAPAIAVSGGRPRLTLSLGQLIP